MLKLYWFDLLWTCYFALPGEGAKYCDEYVCLSVRSHNSKTTRPNFAIFVNVAYVVARSSSDGVAIRCILPVLWMGTRILSKTLDLEKFRHGPSQMLSTVNR